jgi:hypothetical protein
LPQTQPLHQINLLDLNWLWEMNIAQVHYKLTLLFDHFIRGKESPIPWTQRPAKILENDQRAIGALQFNYTTKMGIYLKDVHVRYDREQRTVYYWIPEPQQTGVVDLADHWILRTSLHYVPGKGFFDYTLDWRWRDEAVTNSALPFWEQVRADRYRDALAPQDLDGHLGAVVRNEADRRLKLLFETLMGCRAVAVPKEQLVEAETLGCFYLP